MTSRENVLRAVRFERPDYIPISFSISAGVPIENISIPLTLTKRGALIVGRKPHD